MNNTIFDSNIREQFIQRIERLTPDSKALWGKMSVEQMLVHIKLSNDDYFNKNQKQSFMGKIFGKFVLKSILKEGKPMSKNLPTTDEYRITEKISDNFAELKNKNIEIIKRFENYDNNDFVHDFFGKLTKEQIGILAYKHIDHHLRQFGV